MSSSPSIAASQLAEKYTIEREIGHGATAIVYLALDRATGTRVAIKILREDLIESSTSERFLREMRRHSSLQHPHIVPVLASGEIGNQPYIVLPFMEGGTLRQRLAREKQLPLDDAVSIARAVAEALDYAHKQRILHRDVKPENILFSGTDVSLADFGIARALEHVLGDTTTSTGIVRGTVAYMSPEQASGEHDYDGRTDVYSLGCVLYEMLAGVAPFIAATPEGVLSQRFAHAPRDLRVYRPSVSPALAAVVKKALEFAAADRFRTAGEMAAALSSPALTAESASGDARHNFREGTTPRPRPARRWLAVAAVIVAIATVGGLVAFERSNRGTSRFKERDWVLVADFDGPKDDPDLSGAVRELTTAELNQSRFISTIPRSQLNATMRLAGIPDTTRVDPQLARELAYRSAVRGVLVGSVTRVAAHNYSIVLRVVDADDGSDIWSATGAASDSNLIPTVQKLAQSLREGLGERRKAIEGGLTLDQIATPSLPAYRLYVQALQLQSKGDGRGSNRVLRQAISLDTAFASAWFTMGWNYMNDRMLDSARWAFRQAATRRDRLGEPFRYRVDADVAYVIDYDIPAAVRAYDFYLSQSPRSWAGYNNRGNYLLALGRYEDALESFNRAVASHPFGPQQAQIQVMNQAATLIALGRTSEAEHAARDLTGPFAQYIQLMLTTAKDQWTRADSLGSAVASAPSAPTWLRIQATAIVGASRASRGAVRSADLVLAQGDSGSTREASRWFYRARLLLAAADEKKIPALPVAFAGDTTPGGLVTASLSAAARGDTANARAILGKIQTLPATELRRLGNGPLLVQAWIEGKAGNWQRAADLITPVATRGEHDSSLLDRVGSLSLRWFAADALARSGRYKDATAMLERAIKPERMPGNEFAQRGLVVTFAHRRLGQWYSAAGERAEAAEHWRVFIDSVTDPDPELAPMIAEARRALGQLKSA